MELQHTKCFRKIVPLFILMLVMVVSVPIDMVAQDGSASPKYPPHWQKKLEQMRKHLQDNDYEGQSSQNSSFGVDLQSLSIDSKFTILKQDQEWNRNPNPNPQNNYALFKQGQPAGNINGDSSGTGNPIDDYIVTSLARDEQTSALEDQIWKTAVFYGGNTSGTPDQVIPRKLIPVGDLNGDGYADAVSAEVTMQFPSVNNNSRAYIYKGTDNGYVKTPHILYQGFDPSQEQIGFNDYNRDGADDVLSYNQNSGEIIITWGVKNSLSDVSSSTFSEMLTYDRKRVVVEDIDQDTLKEIVELSGDANYNGQLRILEVDTMAQSLSSYDAIIPQQSFAYSGFRDYADVNDLHLLDINGTGYYEIYISEGRYGPKHVVEYDSVGGQYYTSSIQFFDGSLVPAGDLNNDGKHDFIRGDASDSYMPYIAYSNSDLNSPPQLDVQLSGNGGTDWYWEMGYNPYSKFGDLTGDGVDDVLMEHNRNDEGNETVGRRILDGASQTSVFHQYPMENYYSQTWETEDIGDVNNDGVEDLAFVYYSQKKVEIYHGGTSLSATPNQTIDLSYYPYGITGGDFNNDGTSDVIIAGYEGDSSALTVYFGGSSLTAHTTINASDFQSVSDPDFFNPQNIGDINNDGADDFLIGSGSASDSTSDGAEYVNDAYIFFGGSAISATPDQTISLAPAGYNYIWAGENSASLGDINGDGVNDFAVSVPYLFNEMGGQGRVHIYYGKEGTEPSFSTPDKVLAAPQNTYGFGWGLVSGDFSGDGVRDIAVSAISSFSETEPPKLLHIFNGGEELDSTPERSLILPDIMANNSEQIGYVNFSYSRIETIPDFTNDGKDEIIFSSEFEHSGNSHAAIYTFNSPDPIPEIVVKAPNRGAGLGGAYSMAVGDFTDNGQTDLVLTQAEDNNDAYQSSQIYRYELPVPIKITSVEDVPDDQGGKVHLNLGGAFADAIFQEGLTTNVYEFEVEYLDDNDQWVDKGKYGADADPNGVDYLEVDGLTTQPSNTESVDNSYTFRVKLLDGENPQPIAISDTASGAAYDNIAPPEVTGTSINNQNESPIISWNAVDDVNKVDYLIYSTDEKGQLSDNPVASTAQTSFSLPDSYEGVQSFAVKARDVNNNIGAVSNAAAAIYPQTAKYNVTEGWNLIGLPVDADATAIQDAIQNASSAIYEYNGGYQEVDQVEAGKGYWAKFSSSDLRELVGLPVTQLSLDLKRGWNLISGVGGELPIASVQDPDNIILTSTVYQFDQAYVASDTLRPSNGYWMRASSAGTVTFTHPKLSANQQKQEKSQKVLAEQAEEIEEKFAKITVSDGKHARDLYFGATLPDHFNKLGFTLPPLPPGDVFDARFAKDTRLVEQSETHISLNKIEGTTLTLKVDAQNLTEHNQFVVKEFADGNLLSKYEVNSGKEFNLKHNETNTVFLAPLEKSTLSENQIPEKFELKQNYPNPFNPTTQIRYSVTEATTVQLDVFNILGRKVKTLVNQEQKPGRYNVTFDGSNLASGVYLYRLQAGSKVSTKKLILAK